MPTVFQRGYGGQIRLNLPEGIRLFVFNVQTRKRLELTDPLFGVEYWMRIPAYQILNKLPDGEWL